MIEGCPLDGEDIAIVGSGIGGLAAACYLADAGATVTVLEKNESIGGVIGRLETDGFIFDTGPSWYMMPEVFDRFFGHFGRSTDEYYELERLDPQYRVFFKDGDQVDVTPDLDHVRNVFESYETGAADALNEYLESAEQAYEIGMEQFVYQDRSRLRDLLDPGLLRALPALTRLEPMQEHVADYFEHSKLQQLLQYTLVFLGGSPSNTPALYSLMTHVDLERGVYYPDGGIYCLIDAMSSLCRDLGVTFQTDCEVTDIEPVHDCIRLDTREGSTIAGSVVANANPAHVERDLLDPEYRQYGLNYWNSRTYGPSAFLLYLGVKGNVSELSHHNLIFPTDWNSHFDRIFDDPGWPDDPAYYISVPSKTDNSVAPTGHHAVVILVPLAPGLDENPETREAFRNQILADLADSTGVDIRERIVVERRFTVSDFANRYNTPGGAALGLAHTRTQTGPLRPSHRSAKLNNLYYAGAFTSPGVGIPMGLISGEHAAAAVTDDLTSSHLVNWLSIGG